MVGAQATVVRAAVVGLGVEFVRRLRRLVVVADIFVVRNIVGDQYFGAAVFRAALEHVHLLVFKDNFGINPLEALRAEAEGEIVIGIIPGRHYLEFVGSVPNKYFGIAIHTGRAKPQRRRGFLPLTIK